MDYPQEFSPQARARVEAERLKAGRELEENRDAVPGSRYGPTRKDEENLRQYILRVFLAFAQEACELGLQGSWPVDRIDREAREFLRLLTIEAYYEKGHDKSGRETRDMTSNWTGGILPEIQREFAKSAEWRQYEEGLLAVAERQAHGTPSKPAPAAGAATLPLAGIPDQVNGTRAERPRGRRPRRQKAAKRKVAGRDGVGQATRRPRPMTTAKPKAGKRAAKNPRADVVSPILEQKGWSILDWAVEAKVDYHTANNYLRYRGKPFRSTRLKLARALGIGVTELP